MEGATLVLNKLYQPLYVVSIETAVTLIFQERAKLVLEGYGLWFLEEWLEFSPLFEDSEVISTAKVKLVKPKVVLMTNTTRIPNYYVAFSRKAVYKRDKGRCQYCGKFLTRSESSLDHVVPKSRGGKNTWENIVLSCKKCNLKKKDRTPKEAGMKLLRDPRKISFIELFSPLKEEWKPYFKTPW